MRSRHSLRSEGSLAWSGVDDLGFLEALGEEREALEILMGTFPEMHESETTSVENLKKLQDLTLSSSTNHRELAHASAILLETRELLLHLTWAERLVVAPMPGFDAFQRC